MACRIFVINETNKNNNNNGLMRTVVANVCQKAKANNKRKKNTIQERSRSRSMQQQQQQHHHQGGNKLFAKIEQFPSDFTLRIGIGTAVIGIGDIKNKVRAPSSIRQTHNE